MKKRHSVFDYALNLSFKNRYLMIGSDEFGFELASICVDLTHASPSAIGEAVLQMLARINQKLLEFDRKGLPHPQPFGSRKLRSRTWVSATVASRILGVSRPTLRRMALAGELQAQRTPGGHHRFSLEGISQFLNARSEHAGAPDMSGLNGVVA